MTNKDFYAYCRDNRKSELNTFKREALIDMYNFLWECGVTKSGVKQFAEAMMYQHQSSPKKVAAYQWLLDEFNPQAAKVKNNE